MKVSRPFDAAAYSSDHLYEGARRSAQAIVPLVLDLLHPASVVDFGCGTGVWLAEFAAAGVEDYLGVDAGDAPELAIPSDRFRSMDLTQPVDLGRRFDMAISLEVAEHLPENAARIFVQTITRHADVAVFSAAIPDQRGIDHINEQWPSYWASLFSAEGFGCFDVIRPKVWADESIFYWYRQNTLLFARGLPGHQARPPLDLVHPVFLNGMRNIADISVRGTLKSTLRRRLGLTSSKVQEDTLHRPRR